MKQLHQTSIGNQQQEYWFPLAQQLAQRIYFFKAERMNVSSGQMGASSTLHPNAANLPEVLLNLQSNPKTFSRFNDLVRTILPAVAGVTVKPISPNQAQIMVWTVDPQTE